MCPDNCPRRKLPLPPTPVRVSVWFRVSARVRVLRREGGDGGRQFFSGVIFLEPLKIVYFYMITFIFNVVTLTLFVLA